MNSKVRNLRNVRRFNFHHCNCYQSVAEHSFFVAVLAVDLARDLDLVSAGDFVRAALLHDISEAAIGDIGLLVRRAMPKAVLDSLEDTAREEVGYSPDMDDQLVLDLIEFLDCYELKLYLEEEFRSGNRSLLQIEKETFGRLLAIDIGDDRVKQEWINRLQTINEVRLPEGLTH